MSSPKKTFDVIIIDHAMPVIDGIAFLKILRNQGNAPRSFFSLARVEKIPR